MIGPDVGLAELKELGKKEWSQPSESDTRAKMIDPLFFVVLVGARKTSREKSTQILASLTMSLPMKGIVIS